MAGTSGKAATMIQAGTMVRTTVDIGLGSGRTIPAGHRGIVIRRASGTTRPTVLVDFGWRYSNQFMLTKDLEGVDAADA